MDSMGESSAHLSDSEDEFSDEEEDDFENPDEDKSRAKYRVKNAVIYLLDSQKKMFLEDDSLEHKTPFMQCLKCIRFSMRAQIFASKKTLCAVILIGTGKSDNPLQLKDITLAQPLKGLSADHLLKMDEISKRIDDSSYEKEYSWGDFSLANAIWLASKMFQDASKTVKLNKSLILFTNDDDPSKKSRDELDRIISGARDLVSNEILFDLIHIGQTFNADKLYKELIQLTRNDMDYEIPDPVTTMNEMLQRTRVVDYRHLSLAKVLFHIVGDFKCEVTIHYFVRKAKVPFQIKLSKATNKRVRSEVCWFETESGKVVPAENLVRSYEFGGKEILFTKEELKHIDKLTETGLRLIGFKPASSVSLEDFVKPCAFIYPYRPENVEASSFFVALLYRCLDQKVVPICTFCPRSTSTVRFVALIAQEEEIAPDKTQIWPSGFLVFTLPFAEEVRNLDDKCTGKKRASPEEIEVAKKLVKKLTFNYKPEMFKNPKLASHWNAVEALALDLKEPAPFVDTTIPNLEVMRERTQEIAEEFRNLVYTDSYDPELELLRKKKAPTVSKKADDGLEIDMDHVSHLIRSGDGNRLTSDILKKYLNHVGEGKGLGKMKKADLIEKACNYLKIPAP